MHFRYRQRLTAINPAFDPRAVDNAFHYDGDQSDTGSSTMSGATTQPTYQLETSGFEPIASQATQAELRRIEERLQVLERDEEMRNAARSNILKIRRQHDDQIALKRKREDDEFRSATENAEAEEEVGDFLSLSICLSIL